MKKTIAILLAVLTVISLVGMASAAETNVKYSVSVPADRVDVLDKKVGEYRFDKDGLGSSDASPSDLLPLLTDGVYAQSIVATANNGNSRIFFNQTWAASVKTEPTVGVNVDGLRKDFYYTVDYKNLGKVTVDSFALYYQDDNTGFSASRTDAGFKILVSQDNGVTYHVAYSASGPASNGAGNLVANGGVWTECVTESGNSYWTVSANFDKTYENVTNIMYACVNVRPNRYCARLSEFDVYGPSLAYEVEAEAGRTDILAGRTAAAKIQEGVSIGSAQRNKLTDGIAAYTGLNNTVYLNGAWAQNATEALSLENTRTVSYPGVDGLFDYAFEFSGLGGVSAESFALFAQDERANGSITPAVLDSEFRILISEDGGKTYSVAYQSVKYENDGTANTSQSSKLKENGGDWEKASYCGREYLVISQNLDRVYMNVTNVVYACVYARRSGTSVNPFYYCAKISEFDVYSAKESEAKVVFTVEGGTWADGSVSLTVPVKLINGKGTLAQSSIPTPVPAEGYEAGEWVIVPNTAENAVIGNVKYTYKCKKSIVYTVPELKLTVASGTALSDIALPEGFAWESALTEKVSADNCIFTLSYTFYGLDGSIAKVITGIQTKVALYDSELASIKLAFNSYKKSVISQNFATDCEHPVCARIARLSAASANAYEYDESKRLSENLRAFDKIVAEGAEKLRKSESGEVVYELDDVNFDGNVNLFDLIAMQKELANDASSEFDVFDLIRLKKLIAG